MTSKEYWRLLIEAAMLSDSEEERRILRTETRTEDLPLIEDWVALLESKIASLRQEAWTSSVTSKPLVMSDSTALSQVDLVFDEKWDLDVISRPAQAVVKPAPGHTTLRVARFLCSRQTFERVFCQTLEDMRFEYFEALAHGELWRARWIHVRFFLDLARAAGSSALVRFLQAVLERRKLG